MASNLLNTNARFNKFCRIFERNLPNGFAITKESDNAEYAWIANEEYNLGGYPLHYEIRIENNYLCIEIHYESKSCICYRNSDLKIAVYDFLVNDIGLVEVHPKIKMAHYMWFSNDPNGIPFEINDEEETLLNDYLEKFSEEVEKKFEELINKTDKNGNTVDAFLSKMMKTVWG